EVGRVDGSGRGVGKIAAVVAETETPHDLIPRRDGPDILKIEIYRPAFLDQERLVFVGEVDVPLDGENRPCRCPVTPVCQQVSSGALFDGGGGALKGR